ncbi:MAG: tetratricopeptide repeat protein [Methanospirillum sp.]|nr:tetratricopeptide repeat protein [Methanospirillum sp.]
MGESALERKDYEQASFLFRKAFTADPENIAAIINLGYTYVRMGKFSHARKCFTTALDVDPENPVARKNLSLLMRPGQKTDQYRPRYRPRPEEEIYIRYMQWGNLHFEQKNYYAAIQYFESASSIHPDFIEPFLKIGLSYENLMEYYQAAHAFEEALAIYPGDPVAKEHLEQCHAYDKQEKNAAPAPDVTTPASGLVPDETDISEEKTVNSEKSQPKEEKTLSTSTPQAEADIVMSILAQYSSDQDEKPVEEPIKEPEPVAASPAAVDDPVMSILMQFKDELPEEEQKKTGMPKAADDEIPNTGAAPLADTQAEPEKNRVHVDLNDNQKDALRELGNIGASHAATTLSTMLNTPIMLNVPEISIINLEEINSQIVQGTSAMVIFTMEGQMAKAGYVILHVPQESVVQMTSIMLGLPVESERPLNEMDESAINEIGNIMVSAFLDGTAELLGIIMLPSPPRTIFDLPGNVFNLVIKESNIQYDNIVFFKTELICDEHELNLNIFMLPNPPVLLDIVRMLEKIIEDSASGI